MDWSTSGRKETRVRREGIHPSRRKGRSFVIELAWSEEGGNRECGGKIGGAHFLNRTRRINAQGKGGPKSSAKGGKRFLSLLTRGGNLAEAGHRLSYERGALRRGFLPAQKRQTDYLTGIVGGADSFVRGGGKKANPLRKNSGIGGQKKGIPQKEVHLTFLEKNAHFWIGDS